MSGVVTAYHGSQDQKPVFTRSHQGHNSHTFGKYDSIRHGTFFSDNPKFAAFYGDVKQYQISLGACLEGKSWKYILASFVDSLDAFDVNERDVWMAARNILQGNGLIWNIFEGDVGERFIEFAKSDGYDSAVFSEANEDDDGREIESLTYVIFDPTAISGGQPIDPSLIAPDAEDEEPADDEWDDDFHESAPRRSIRDYIALVESKRPLNENSIPGIDPALLVDLATQGFDVTMPLYHGSDADFDTFDRSMSRTARDIYTAPDIETARAYGHRIYLCVGRMGPQADLIDDWRLLGKIAETFAEDNYGSVDTDEDLETLKQEIIQQGYENDPDYDEWDATDDPRYKAMLHKLAKTYVMDSITGGEIYGHSGSFQNVVMQECFAEGYKSVRLQDPSSTGESVSIVFHDPANIKILRVLE